MKKKFIFVAPGTVPIANLRMWENISAAFPDYEGCFLNCTAALKAQPITLAILAFRALLTFGPRILVDRRLFRKALWCSPATAAWIKAWVARRIDEGGVAFTMQMQSLFDASDVRRPHFVYTDHTIRDNETSSIPEWAPLRSAGVKAREKRIYDNARAVFVRSENVRRTMVSYYGCSEEKVLKVRAGANVKTVATPQIARDPQAILFVGIDWDRKGGPELLEAFRAVAATHPKARLVIVGAAPEIPADLERVEVKGRLPVDALGALYAEAGIFCLPTRHEPFGIAFLEAMNYALPVVGTNLGAQPDFILPDETGYLVEARDVRALTSALNRLLDNPEQARRMGLAGQALVRESYNWKAVTDKMSAEIHKHIAPEGAAS